MEPVVCIPAYGNSSAYDVVKNDPMSGEVKYWTHKQEDLIRSFRTYVEGSMAACPCNSSAGKAKPGKSSLGHSKPMSHPFSS